MSHGGDTEVGIALHHSTQEVEEVDLLAGKGLAGLGLAMAVTVDSAKTTFDPWIAKAVSLSSPSWI